MDERGGPTSLAITPLERADLVPFLDDIPPREVRLLCGCSFAELSEQLAVAPAMRRPVLALRLAGSTPGSLREGAIAQLARAVGELWPSAWGGDDFDGLRNDALGLAVLPIRLAGLASRLPEPSRASLSSTWAREAVAALLRGRDPRVPSAPDIEWRQLALMLSPAGVTVAVQRPRGPSCDAFVAAVEWLAQRGDAAVAVLAEAPPPAVAPWTRLLYGARSLAPASAEAPPGSVPETPPEALPEALPETPARPRSGPAPAETPTILGAPRVEGRPHPLSAVELRLYRSIQADAELQPLFGFNIPVTDAALLRATADLLWREGRVAVEVDGAEHRAAAKYRADRDRDHRLMCVGYRVLRLTNEEVLEDCGRAVEKIREVVRLAGAKQPGMERG